MEAHDKVLTSRVEQLRSDHWDVIKYFTTNELFVQLSILKGYNKIQNFPFFIIKCGTVGNRRIGLKNPIHSFLEISHACFAQLGAGIARF
jgi:hypothetical protein